jgi:hypothetical protein
MNDNLQNKHKAKNKTQALLKQDAKLLKFDACSLIVS